MPSIFADIKGIQHARPKETLLITKPRAPQKQDLVTAWQMDPSSLNTKAVLLMLKPTIDSALHSYTPGQLDSYRLKATALALLSLHGYDKSKATAPSTFVFTNLQRLNRIRRLRETPIHIPLSQVYALQLVLKKSRLLEDRLGRLPTDLLLSDFIGISRKKILKIKSDTTAYLSHSSTTDAESGLDLLGQSGESLRDFYNYVYDSVSPTDKKIMLWTSGYDRPQLSNNLIAIKLHMSPGAVSQHKAKIQLLLGRIRGLV